MRGNHVFAYGAAIKRSGWKRGRGVPKWGPDTGFLGSRPWHIEGMRISLSVTHVFLSCPCLVEVLTFDFVLPVG